MRTSLVGKILIGFALGTGVGLFLAEGRVSSETAKTVISYVAPFGNVLVAMLKMVVYPIILFSLILVVALCFGINPILDMFETCCNVTGDNVCTYIVAKRTGFLFVRAVGEHAEVSKRH